MRFVAAEQHPDHDTIAAFRRDNARTFKTAFLQVLLLARESGFLTLGTVSIDGTEIGANVSKIRSVRCDRMQALRAKLAADIAALTAKAEAADPQALPQELARRETLKGKLDAACDRLEAEARAAHGQAKAKAKAEHEAEHERRRRPARPGRAAARARAAEQPDRSRQRLRVGPPGTNTARPTTPRPWSMPKAASRSRRPA